MLLLLFTTAWASCPQSWLEKFAQGNMLVSTTEPSPIDPSIQATLGNGLIGTIVGAEYLYVNGLFNGFKSVSPSHGARLPNPLNLKLEGMVQLCSGLDLQQALFERYWGFGSCYVTESIYADRERAGLLVHSFHIEGGATDYTFNLRQDLNQTSSSDVNITSTKYYSSSGIWKGSTLIGETVQTGTASFALTFDVVPETLSCVSGSTTDHSFYLYVSTNLDSEKAVHLAPRSHAEAWAELWESGFEVAGNSAVSTLVNSTLYYIYSSLRADHPWGPTPGAIASNAYNKHVFWDSEFWILPATMVFAPDLAKAALQYRLNKLPGYCHKAANYKLGYHGCAVAWESAFTGQETCPLSALTGELEVHISSDVVLALRNYYYFTGDLAFLKQAWPLVKLVAEFWLTRVSPVASRDPPYPVNYHIDNVIPPDEYAVGVNDSVFTNAATKLALEFAAEAARDLEETVNPQWELVASRLMILFNTTNQVHPEYAGYEGGMVKQADAILLNYPLMYPGLTSASVKADLDYYAVRTDEKGPCMSDSAFCIGYLSIGDNSTARDYLYSSFTKNVHSPWNIWSEVKDAVQNTNFISGGGGFLQAVVYGYSGLRIRKDRLEFSPQMIPHSEGWKIRRLLYKGVRFSLTHEENGTTWISDIEGVVIVCTDICQPLRTGETFGVDEPFYVHI